MSDTQGFFRRNAGNFYPAVAFEQIGATIVGTIIDEPRIVVTKDDDRNDVENLVVNLEAVAGTAIRSGKVDEGRADVKPGDQVSLWIKAGGIARAVDTAIKAAKVAGLAEGGTLAVQYTGNGTPTKAGYTAPKLYSAEYSAPRPTVGMGGLIGNQSAAVDQGAPF